MIDLHLHSTCSDGSESPERVVELAAEAGCSAIALTDHDGFFGLAAARAQAAELGVSFVPGCEVSCYADPGTLHLLCYFIGEGDNPVAAHLADLRADRERRNAEMFERLATIGFPIDPAEVSAEAGNDVIGRPHVAAVLVRHGFASSIDDAFERIIAKGRPGYVERAPVEARVVVERCRDAGGVAVVAHPLSYDADDKALAGLFEDLVPYGLAGAECYYGRYDPETRERLVALARTHGLVPTGGSDFHGSYKPDLSVGSGRGDLVVPDEVLDELTARRATRL